MDLELGAEIEMLGIELGRNEGRWNVLDKTVGHIVLAASQGEALELREEVGNLVVTFGGNLFRSEGLSGWEISAEGVDQSLLVVAFKSVVSDELSAVGKFILWGWESAFG
jgi:hypothetical protein